MYQIWTILEKFGQVFNNLDKSRSSWTILNNLSHVLTSLVKFGEIQTIFDRFEQF